MFRRVVAATSTTGGPVRAAPGGMWPAPTIVDDLVRDVLGRGDGGRPELLN
jgi:hypothetical protein